MHRRGTVRIAALIVSASVFGGCAVVEGHPGYRTTVSVYDVQPVYPSPRAYYRPAPVYIAPAPVYMAPSPIYVEPPVYLRPPVTFGFHFRSEKPRHRHSHRHGHRYGQGHGYRR